MKANIETSDWRKIYVVEADPNWIKPDKAVEIPDELAERFFNALREFVAVQRMLKPYHES